MATRTFFRDCQEWEWIPRRFDPTRALAVPRSIAALIGTNPRVIADDVWAKLLWAGLNLDRRRPARQLRRHLLPDGADPGGHADLAVLRAAQRRDHPAAGRVHPLAARRRRPSPATPATILADDAVCLLDVPVHKTGTAFTKPVDPLVGQAIDAWQALRPDQPTRFDRKTGERSTCCSPSAPSPSPRTTSTARSSRRCAARPASRPPTSAATSPATAPDRPSPASSTTPRSR